MAGRELNKSDTPQNGGKRKKIFQIHQKNLYGVDSSKFVFKILITILHLIILSSKSVPN